MTNQNAPSPFMKMLHMATGCWVSQAIYAAAKLGIADRLAEGPQSCSVLASSTETNADALYRLLRALASLGVFEETTSKVFQLTPLADCLRSDAPNSLRAFSIMLGEEAHWQAWGDVLYSVKTGEPAFDHVFGMPHFKYFAANPEAGRLFNEGMTSRSGQENTAIISAYDFSGLDTVIDVGGGQGTLLASILKASPKTQGLLFDLPHVIAAARTSISDGEISLRYKFQEGDFFDAVPTGGSAYTLKKVIHDWDDERALKILKNCRKAISPTSRLLLLEPIVPEGNDPSFNKLLDLLILIWTSGGKDRTEAEHQTLLAAAGFKVVRVIPTSSPLSIIEAVPAN